MANANTKITADIVEAKPANDDKPVKQNSGMGIIFLLLIIIAGVTGAAGYYLWQQQQLLSSDLQSSETSLTSQVQQLEQLSQTQQQSLQQLLHSQQGSLEQLKQQLNDANTLSQQAINITNRNQRDWVLAEIDYLLRIANQRLQIFRDINGAIAALSTANDRLFELGDLRFFEVRKQLNDDIAKLKAIPQVDINGTALKLDQIFLSLEALPFKPVQEELKAQLETTTDASTKKPAESFVESVIDTVMNIGDIKIHQRSIQPKSNASQQQQIDQLLKTYLLSSRLAVLRYDDKQFNHDLEQALQLLHLHFKADDNRVAQIVTDLLELKNLNLTPDLPNINQSWVKLQDLNNKPVQKLKSDNPAETL